MAKNEAKINKDTPIIEAVDIAREFGLKKAFIKDESINEYGTIKDRRNRIVVTEADRLKIDKLVLITSGNNGYSLAGLAKDTNLKVVCVVDRDLSSNIKTKLAEVAYHVIELNLKHKILRPEELIAFAREREDEVIWEVTNGYEDAYGSAVDEIIKTTRPNYIVVPIGSGGIYTGFIRAIERNKSETKVIGIGVQNTNFSLADKLYTPWTPYTKTLEYYNAKGHKIYRLSEDEVRKNHNRFKQLMNCEPSSSVVFAALQKHIFSPDDIVVFVNSGKAYT